MAIKLSTGLRQALLGARASKSAVVTYTATTIAAVDGGGSADTFTDSANGFVTGGFAVGDSIMTFGWTGDNAGSYGPFVLTGVEQGTLTVATGSIIASDAASESITIVALKGGAWRDIFKDGVLDIYSGAMPATADAAETGTKLVSVTVASGAFTAGLPAAGLEFGAPSAGAIAKDSDTWSGVGLATGEAGYYVFYDNAYTTGSSSSAIRFMGTCGESGTDMVMSDATVTEAATKTIDTFIITLPAY